LSDATDALAKSVRGRSASDADGAVDSYVSLRSRAYLEQARACEETDRQAVEEALELLRSGRLDTPESALRAAQNILDLGL